MGNALVAWIRALFFRKQMELTVIGLAASGKSTLVNRFATGRFEEMAPTMGFCMKQATRGSVTIKMWDVGGQDRFREMWERYCRNVDAVIFMVDLADPQSVPIATRELHRLVDKLESNAIALLVLGNKSDLPQAMSLEHLIEMMNLKSITNREVSSYAISAKTMSNLDHVLDWLIGHANRVI